MSARRFHERRMGGDMGDMNSLSSISTGYTNDEPLYQRQRSANDNVHFPYQLLAFLT